MSTRGSLCAKARPARKFAAEGQGVVVERAEIFAEDFDLLELARRRRDGVADPGEPRELGRALRRRGVVHVFLDDRRRRGGGNGFLRAGFDPAEREGEIHLVFLAQRPRLDPARPQVARERRRVAVERQHAPGFDQFDVAQQIGVVGVVAQRETRVRLVTMHRPGRQRPAGEHRGAAGLDLLEHPRLVGARRADEHLAGDVGGVVPLEVREIGLEFAVNLRHAVDRAVEHRGQAGTVERAEDFLALAQRIAEQHRHHVLLQRLAAKFHDLREHFLRRRETEARQPEGRFHDERVGLRPAGRLGGKARRAA